MSVKFGSIMVVILVAMTLAAGSAQAGWLMTHGSATQISDHDCILDNNWRDQDGLTVIPRTNSVVSLVIPMPTPGEANMRLTKVKVSFSTGFSSAIKSMKVYDGSVLVFQTNGNWWGIQSLTYKTPPRVFTSGMVMCLDGYTSFPPDVWWRRIVIHNAGGYFKPTP